MKRNFETGLGAGAIMTLVFLGGNVIMEGSVSLDIILFSLLGGVITAVIIFLVTSHSSEGLHIKEGEEDEIIGDTWDDD